MREESPTSESGHALVRISQIMSANAHLFFLYFTKNVSQTQLTQAK